MQLISPTLRYRDSWQQAIDDFKAADIGGFWNLPEKQETLEEYIQITTNHAQGVALPEGWVPSTTYWLIVDEIFVGHINIRHELNDYLAKIGGHIGYAIAPAHQKKGYGYEILRLALPKAKELGLTSMLLTCDDTNIGSQKIIERNGGILEGVEEFAGNERPVRRYWVG